MSRRCPKCKTVYAGEARFCPKDGSPLVDVGGTGGKPLDTGGAAKTEVRKVAKAKPGPSLSRAGSLTNQVLDSRYEIVRKLGEGGMAFVYEARDMSTGRAVAIKVLSPKLSRDQSSVERLRREAGLAMRLEHPNACKILRLGETEDGLIYLVMPYLKGELLSDREVKVGPMAAEEGVEILVHCCAGLHHAHQLNIVHRDLKPENIMLVTEAGGRETAIVMDFGLAKENRAGPGVAKLTATGIILGTPEFMSPEQIRGKKLDARSDVYALGIVAFEMFTGKLPFQGRTPQEMMIARLRGKPTPLRQFRSDFPARLEAALMKSLEADPKDRYGTTLEFGYALVDATDSEDRERLKGMLQ
ncbi:MAG: protein kinase [Gemmatimonadales bacterium]|nr:protein kinase [Gemmatimonadales bacterium]NIN11098.1 protein kinase [Gemmatimonadales bacterium]NIN49695.1 protein kinase [Gemmatimonadales bacterium]NIP07159.1 protein kinase [Gemmatimonadales bacterium]NIQ99551.1 protein kinase [Gemmatimonadales bacterium]